ncbi:MAG: CDP-glucose 4,6-dehydratase [Thermoanaerobaculia bacterium]|nr:CDP-glucose 4,6-dehydratase [Thermoanaerobaculia bacterium]
MQPAFWQGKKVLLTGHTGFKGSWLALWLERLGAEVTGVALAPPTQPSLFEQARVAEGMVSLEADIRERDAVRDPLERCGGEVVFHLAAQSLVRRSYREPLETFSTNVMGTAKVLEAARRVPSVRAVVVVTSDKCYENLESRDGYREEDRLGGHDPYAASKACAELVTAAYRRSYFSADDATIAVATGRAGNVIGGGDWAEDRLVPDLIRGLAAGRPVSIRHPDAVRPWQHVLEPLAGYLTLAEALWQRGAEVAEAWNFGPETDELLTVGEIAEMLCQRWSPPGEWIHDAADHPPETGLLHVDSSKARRRLGWRPRWSVRRSLDSILEWHRAAAEGGDPRQVTLRQIADYERSIGTARTTRERRTSQ